MEIHPIEQIGLKSGGNKENLHRLLFSVIVESPFAVESVKLQTTAKK